MKKITPIAITLIIVILVGFSYYDNVIKPKQEAQRIEAEKMIQDMIEDEPEIEIEQPVYIPPPPIKQDLAQKVLQAFLSRNPVIEKDESFGTTFASDCFSLLIEDTGDVSIKLLDGHTIVFNIRQTKFNFDNRREVSVQYYNEKITHYVIVQCYQRDNPNSSNQLCIKTRDGHYGEYEFQVYDREQAVQILQALQALRDSYN